MPDGLLLGLGALMVGCDVILHVRGSGLWLSRLMESQVHRAARALGQPAEYFRYGQAPREWAVKATEDARIGADLRLLNRDASPEALTQWLRDAESLCEPNQHEPQRLVFTRALDDVSAASGDGGLVRATATRRRLTTLRQVVTAVLLLLAFATRAGARPLGVRPSEAVLVVATLGLLRAFGVSGARHARPALALELALAAVLATSCALLSTARALEIPDWRGSPRWRRTLRVVGLNLPIAIPPPGPPEVDASPQHGPCHPPRSGTTGRAWCATRVDSSHATPTVCCTDDLAACAQWRNAADHPMTYGLSPACTEFAPSCPDGMVYVPSEPFELGSSEPQPGAPWAEHARPERHPARGAFCIMARVLTSSAARRFGEGLRPPCGVARRFDDGGPSFGWHPGCAQEICGRAYPTEGAGLPWEWQWEVAFRREGLGVLRSTTGGQAVVHGEWVRDDWWACAAPGAYRCEQPVEKSAVGSLLVRGLDLPGAPADSDRWKYLRRVVNDDARNDIAFRCVAAPFMRIASSSSPRR